MDHLARFRLTTQRYLGMVIFLQGVLVIGGFWAIISYTSLTPITALIAIFVASALQAWFISIVATNLIIQPLQALWQAVLHLSPTEHGIAAPKPEELKVGQELVTSLTAQIYQLADVAQHAADEGQKRIKDLTRNFIAQSLPLPLFVLDATETIKFANQAAVDYIGIAAEDLIGKNVYMVLDMSFPSEDTFDTWLKSVKVKTATAARSWERVRLNVRDNHPALLFDLAAYYNRDNPDGDETLLTLFDHTKQYSQDDQAVSFIALSVHELRTPLTLLRGYIEVFEEELSGKVDAELQSFMEKMRAQAEQLMAFVNNILNVARVDDDQLELHLSEENWGEMLKKALEALSLRAKVRGITLHCKIEQNLPAVGADRLSIYEVINNLIDNAIKYSGTSKIIEIDTHRTMDGLVETTVQDFGLGISTSIMPNLFTKFYRDHRNRAQIGGTGLGLYLSKAIITAHGGSLWVRSKPGEGSTFGFTLIPYTQLNKEAKKSGSDQLVRGAHGWIKNHSLYRR
jgi:signal transduction histidine kinase